MEYVLPFQTNKGLDHILAKYIELPIQEMLRLNLKPWINVLGRIKGELLIGYGEPIMMVPPRSKIVDEAPKALGLSFRFINKKVKLLEVGKGVIIID